MDESIVEDASGPKEEIKLANENQESEQSDAESGVIDDLEDNQPRMKMTSPPKLLSLYHQAPDMQTQLIRQVVTRWGRGA